MSDVQFVPGEFLVVARGDVRYVIDNTVPLSVLDSEYELATRAHYAFDVNTGTVLKWRR